MQSTVEETLPKVAKEVNESMEAGLIDSVLMKLQSFQNDRDLGSLCVGIASCDSGCGATTIAARLAAQAALNGMGNVLLVDANYNRPAVHRRFRVKRGPGLLDSLVKGLDVPECIQPTDHADLNLMTLGSKELSTQSVSPIALRPFFDDLRSRYQLVILDLPVIVQAGIGLFFASQTDGTIVVLDGKTTKTRQAKAVVDLMKENQVPVVGAILNKHTVVLPRWLARWF